MSHARAAPAIVRSPGEWPWHAAGLAAVAMLGCLLVGGGLQSASAPFPFVWLDVALVQFASTVPMALLVAAAILRAAGSRLCFLLAAAAFAAAVVLTLLASPATASLAADLQRLLPAAALALAAALVVVAGRSTRWQPSAASLLMAIAVAAFLPPLYVHARTRNDLSRLSELLGQMRLGEAQTLAESLARLNPALQFAERSIGDVASDLGRQVDALTARSLTPLPPDADHEQLLARAQDLAILNFTEEALAVIDFAEQSRESPAAANLRGTIHESRGEWSKGLAAYEHARKFHASNADGTDRANRERAVTGMAFCHRKLGNKAAAAAAYQELLGLAPTADTHFLLAQFYDDTQQAAMADEHARMAMLLDPENYAQRGSQLIDKLRTTQFSCWAIGR